VTLPFRLAAPFRTSLSFIVPLLHRCGEVTVPMPSGNLLGDRRIDEYLCVLSAFGAHVTLGVDGMHVHAGRGLAGTAVSLGYPSVGVTETAIMAASVADGSSVIRNMNVSPEVLELITFLRKMGACINFTDDRTVRVVGSTLGGSDHCLGADRIDCFTYLSFGVATRGRVLVAGVDQNLSGELAAVLRSIGAKVRVRDDTIEVFPSAIRPISRVSGPYRHVVLLVWPTACSKTDFSSSKDSRRSVFHAGRRTGGIAARQAFARVPP
jgi:UDP-N-acetylglucosamine 1-carboxyvinyltransferase